MSGPSWLVSSLISLSFFLMVVLFIFLVDMRKMSLQGCVASSYHLQLTQFVTVPGYFSLDAYTQMPEALRLLFSLVPLQCKLGKDSSSNTAHGYLVWF